MALHRTGETGQAIAELGIPLCAIRSLRNTIQTQTDHTLQRLDEILGP